jgi:putative nucleotidyltransferase with HDIG domain
VTTDSLAERRRGAVVDFAHDLVIAALNREIHAPDSRFVEQALRDMVTSLRHASEVGVPMPLVLQLSEDRLHYDGQPLYGPSLQARSLLRCCSERHIAALAFDPALDVEEANRSFDLLLTSGHRDALGPQQREAAMRAFGIRHVQVTQRESVVGRGRSEPEVKALHSYQDLAASLQHNHALAYRDHELDVDAAYGAVERTLNQLEEPSLLLALAAKDDVDRFTVGHSVRVALLALQVARTLGASRERLVQVGSAALLHDIGKSKVPQEILFKQGPLSADEWALMAQHPRLGAQILLVQPSGIDANAVGAAFCHHMGPTGIGYPKPLLPIVPSGLSRLIRVCDVFEALTSVRPYKHALTPIEAYAVMFRSEKDFDPAWLHHFARTLGLFPTGTRVRLDDDSEAIVTEQTACFERPRVRLLAGPGGGTLSPGHPESITIGQMTDGVVRRIAGVAMHDRRIAVPDFGADPEVLTQSPQHACLSHPAPGEAPR